jgi:hypothetical protein
MGVYSNPAELLGISTLCQKERGEASSLVILLVEWVRVLLLAGFLILYTLKTVFVVKTIIKHHAGAYGRV